MRIDQLSVECFRHFPNATWDFAPEFNILIGDNGSGKSSVLQALRIAAGSFFLGIDGLTAPSITKEDIRYEIDRLEHSRAVKRTPFPVRVGANGFVNETAVSWSRERHSEQTNTTYGGAKQLLNVAAELQRRAREKGNSVIFPVIAYYGPGRLFRQLQDRSSRPITPKEVTYAYHGSLVAESDFDYQMAWWRTQILKNDGRVTGLDYLDGMCTAILATLGDDWNELAYDFDLGGIIVRNPENEWHPVKSLSDGQRTVLAMALDIAYRCTTLNPHLNGDAVTETPGVVLIDEIDLHLHPRWQRTITSNLHKAFPKVQFIASTHSPLIIQNLNYLMDKVIDLAGGDFLLTTRSSPEDILKRMGVEIPQQSADWLNLYYTAQKYYDLLERAKTKSNSSELAALRRNLDALSIPFEDNPAWAALLERKRAAAEIDG